MEISKMKNSTLLKKKQKMFFFFENSSILTQIRQIHNVSLNNRKVEVKAQHKKYKKNQRKMSEFVNSK